MMRLGFPADRAPCAGTPTPAESTADAIVAGVLAVGVLIVALLFYTLFSWSDRIDSINRRHELAVVQNGLQSLRNEANDAIAAVTQGDFAVIHIDNRFDPQWVDQEIGAPLNQAAPHADLVVLDGANTPVYARQAGHDVAAGALAPLTAAAAPLIERVRAMEAVRPPYVPATSTDHMISAPIRASAVRVVNGAPYMLTATLVQPDFGRVLPIGPRSAILLYANRFDAGVLDRLSSRFQLERARLAYGAPAAGADEAQVFLRDADGRPVATVIWTPQRPGHQLLGAALPVVSLVCAGLGLGLLLAMAAVRGGMRRLRVAFDELTQSRNAADAANRAKSDFLATMSHEIRTPLNGILGMAQIMLRASPEPEQRQRLAIISQSGEALLAVLNDMLDLSKIEAGKLELEPVVFDLAPVVNGVCATFTPIAQAKGLSFAFSIAESAQGIWRGDSSRLRQILYNLVSNAVKFTEAGQITVAIAGFERDGAKWLQMRVADTGVGIAAGKVETVFDKFVQADSSHSRRFTGTGLGLAICRELATLMGGSIRVDSKEGAGSTFTVETPVHWIGPDRRDPNKRRDRLESAASAIPDPKSLRILAAEDNPTNQLVLKTVLTSLGFSPVVVENGREAVEAWRSGAYDLILMDIQMPEMDGIQATQQIRALEGQGSRHTPIIAVSANAMNHQVAEYLAAGMDSHLAKPLDIGKLAEALEVAERTARNPIRRVIDAMSA